MANVCSVCSKKVGVGNNVSHSHRKTRRRFLPNIQKKTITVGGKKKQIKICANCLRSQGKVKK